MTIIFFGSSHFGLPSLKALREGGHHILCVVTQPDRKKGRGLHISKTVIKEYAESAGLRVYQPDKVNGAEAIDLFLRLKPDLLVVIAYGQILSQRLLDIPAILPVNVHSSLLPAYRGAAPINWAIIKGEAETGVSIMKMAAAMDTGPVITQKKVNIGKEDTFITLENKLSVLAADVLMDCLDSIGKKDYKLTPQDESKATFAPKLTKNDGLIDWHKQACEIYNLIRGCLGWPDAFTYYRHKLLKIHAASIVASVSLQNPGKPGEIINVSKQGITVAAGKGAILIKELQIEGKRRMKVEEFITGHHINPGDVLGDENTLLF